MCKIITTFAPSKNVGVVIRKPTVIHFNRIKQSITHSTQPPRQATNVRDMCALIKGFSLPVMLGLCTCYILTDSRSKD